MRRAQTMTPLAAVTAGALAGLAGTACLDGVRFLRQRRAGGQQDILAWEFPPVPTWDQAPEPGIVAKRVIEGFTQRPLPDRYAWLTSTVAHWAYGSSAAAAYGVLAGSARRPSPLYGLPFGAAVWLSGYVLLPQAGLYKPIWEYDLETLADDLTGHLAYGTGVGVTFWLASAAWRLTHRRA
jgi:hypothetical protein